MKECNKVTNGSSTTTCTTIFCLWDSFQLSSETASKLSAAAEKKKTTAAAEEKQTKMRMKRAAAVEERKYSKDTANQKMLAVQAAIANIPESRPGCNFGLIVAKVMPSNSILIR